MREPSPILFLAFLALVALAVVVAVVCWILGIELGPDYGDGG